MDKSARHAIKQYYPNSIMNQYLKNTNKIQDSNYMAKTLKSSCKLYSTQHTLPSNTCLIHIRLGDILTNSKKKIHTEFKPKTI